MILMTCVPSNGVSRKESCLELLTSIHNIIAKHEYSNDRSCGVE